MRQGLTTRTNYLHMFCFCKKNRIGVVGGTSTFNLHLGSNPGHVLKITFTFTRQEIIEVVYHAIIDRIKSWGYFLFLMSIKLSTMMMIFVTVVSLYIVS